MYTTRRNSIPSKQDNGCHALTECKTNQEQVLCCAVHDYLLHLQASGRTTATLASYTESLILLGQCVGSVLPLRKLTPNLLNAAVVDLAAVYGQSHARRSQTTLNRHRSAYRGFFSWAFQTKRILTNPALLLGRSNMESVPTLPITLQETRSFLSAIHCSNDPLRLRDEALFSMYALTGLRRAEALRLDIADYDAGTKVLRVKNGKNGRSRIVPVVHRLGLLLEEFQQHCMSQNRVGDGKLFPGRTPSAGLTVRQAQRRFQYWKSVAGIRPGLTIHSFRAGFATMLHRHSLDIVLVSRTLGHGDLRPTLRYIESSAGELPQIMEGAFREI